MLPVSNTPSAMRSKYLARCMVLPCVMYMPERLLLTRFSASQIYVDPVPYQIGERLHRYMLSRFSIAKSNRFSKKIKRVQEPMKGQGGLVSRSALAALVQDSPP